MTFTGVISVVFGWERPSIGYELHILLLSLYRIE